VPEVTRTRIPRTPVNRQEYTAWVMACPATLVTIDTSDGDRKERFMDEHRTWAPDLEQLDERQAQRFREEMFSTLSAEK
jgi:hypothetical protein